MTNTKKAGLKKIENYTNEELLLLTDQEVDLIIKLHLADAGIKFPVKPEEPTYFAVPEADTTVYRVTGADVLFSDKAVAEEVAKVMREHISSLYITEYFNGDYEHQTLKSAQNSYNFNEGIQVVVVRHYSKELLKEISDNLAQNKQLKKDYEAARAEYDSAYKDGSEIMEEVRSVVRNAKEAQREKQRLLEHYKEYLELAANNKDIAWNFMKKAYSVSQDQEDYINAYVNNPF